MKVTINDVLNKLNEYGFTIYNDYPTEDQGHCFITKKMMFFLNTNDDSLSITFQADIKPKIVAENILILNEIKNIKDISIMESYIYDKNNKFITGKKADVIVKNEIIQEAFQKLAKQQVYASILTNEECFDC